MFFQLADEIIFRLDARGGESHPAAAQRMPGNSESVGLSSSIRI